MKKNSFPFLGMLLILLVLIITSSTFAASKTITWKCSSAWAPSYGSDHSR